MTGLHFAELIFVSGDECKIRDGKVSGYCTKPPRIGSPFVVGAEPLDAGMTSRKVTTNVVKEIWDEDDRVGFKTKSGSVYLVVLKPITQDDLRDERLMRLIASTIDDLPGGMRYNAEAADDVAGAFLKACEDIRARGHKIEDLRINKQALDGLAATADLSKNDIVAAFCRLGFVVDNVGENLNVGMNKRLH